MDPRTVKKQLEEKDKGRVKTEISNKLDESREIWLELLTEYSEKSITLLRSIRPDIYSWLYRNDKEWLMSYKPIMNESRIYSNNRVDWGRRDNEICAQVELIANTILCEIGKPIRVSKYEIGRRLFRVTYLLNNLVKLPRTRETLNRVVESVEWPPFWKKSF